MENSKIKIVGVGEEGENILKRFAKEENPNVDLLAIDVDGAALNKLAKTGVIRTVLIGKNVSIGLEGAMLGERAAEESAAEIKKSIDQANAIIIVATLGGKAASGATPVIARLAKEMKIKTVALMSMPFLFEGARRHKLATTAIEKLKPICDELLVHRNDELVEQMQNKKESKVSDLFKAANEVVCDKIRAKLTELESAE
ncbi:MAG: hypothetical protein IJ575_01545 [Selenomonadaceae bacterium]|nr:hypothetical protein [Selenomonadaceae bacterium]